MLVRLIQQQRVARLLIGKDCFALPTNMPARSNIPIVHESRIDKPTGGKRNALLFTVPLIVCRSISPYRLSVIG